jgi:membrane associated rhomboid family serine protease
VPLRVLEVPAVFFAGLWFVLQLLSGVGGLGAVTADGAQAVAAHLTGLAAGAGCGAYFRFGAGSLRRYWREVG